MNIKVLLIIIFWLSLAQGFENDNYVIEDTMMVEGKDGLFRIPNSTNRKDEFAVLEKNSVVYVVEKKPIPNELKGTGIEYFIKVKTVTGQTGYIWIKSLITKKQFQQHQDSLKLWTKLPQPQYKNLIGTTYFKDSDLPSEIVSGEFISTGEKGLYGIISFCNKYNGNYFYLFFVIEDKSKGDGLKILDIIPLNSTTIKKGSSLWFKQCECLDKSTDCSDVVAIYYHDDEMAKKNILINPDKAWKPNYKTSKLETIPPESVKCGSMAADEGEE
jgi:hypothetical protein